MTPRTVSPRTYLTVFGVLIVLTGATTGAAYVDLGSLNVVVALTIATAKALLVVLFFMHLTHSAHRTQILAGAGILWLAIMIAFTLSDVLTRNLLTRPGG